MPKKSDNIVATATTTTTSTATSNVAHSSRGGIVSEFLRALKILLCGALAIYITMWIAINVGVLIIAYSDCCVRSNDGPFGWFLVGMAACYAGINMIRCFYDTGKMIFDD